MATTKIAVVRFEGNTKQYDFKTDIEGLDAGDKVVVDTSIGFSIAKVHSIKDVSKAATKWVVQKVDLAGHQVRLEKEKKFQGIKDKMETRRKELEEVNIYRILAKEDEGMALLLKEMDALN